MRWSTCVRPRTRKWCSRLPLCERCGLTWTPEWRRFLNVSASSSARSPERPPSRDRARPPSGPHPPQSMSGPQHGLLRLPQPRPRPERRQKSGGARPSVPCAAARSLPTRHHNLPTTLPPHPRRPPKHPRRHPARRPAPSAGAAVPPSHRRIDRDSLTEAWGDGILQSLPARAKARYASGRFVEVDDQGAHFALPNAAHRDQCAEQQTLVEAALADHFGTNVALVLVIDDAAPPPASGSSPGPSLRPSGAGPSNAGPPADEVEEVVDPHDFMEEDDSTDQASAAEARLLQAFPGASEVGG